MKSGLVVLFIASSLIISSCSKSSGVTSPGSSAGWTQIGGLRFFNEIIAGGSDLYAAGIGGVFRSTDDGMSWSPVGSGLPAGNYNVTLNGSTLIASDNGQHGAYVSTDGGASWSPADSGLVPEPGAASAGNYQAITSLYSYGSVFFAGIQGSGVYTNTVPPSVWTASGIDTSTVFAFLNVGTKLFAGTRQGIYVSTDNGTTWSTADSGLVDSSSGVGGLPYIESLAAHGTTVYAGALDGNIYVSTDDGSGWTNVTGAIPGGIGSGAYVAALDSSVALADYTGAFYSTDGGSTWTDITDNIYDPVITAAAAVNGYLYICSANGSVWRRPF